MTVMEGHLITADGRQHGLDGSTIEQLLHESARFWLELACPDREQYLALLRDTFGFHPLAVEDAEHFG